MAATSGWGQLAYSSAYWGGIGVDETVSITGNQVRFLSPKTNNWGIDFWGIDTWGGSVPNLNVIGQANILPAGVSTPITLGDLTFTGKSFYQVSGNSVTVADGTPTAVAKSIVNASTNLLQFQVQSPNISADGFTEAVVGNSLSAETGDVGFKLDAIFSADASEVTIGTTEPTVALPTVVPLLPGPEVSTQVGTVGFKLDAIFSAIASSVTLGSGTVIPLASADVLPTGNSLTPAVGTLSFESRYYVTGSSVQTSTGTLDFSTQQNIQVSANVLTLGSGSLIITNWQQIITNDNQTWTPIATGDTQTWTPL